MGKVQDIFERLSNLNSIMKKKILKKIVETNIQKCPYCISQDFIKNGNENTRKGKVQKYICKNCKRIFRDSTGTAFSKARISIKEIEQLFEYFEKGLTSREIKRKGLKISHVTICKWKKKLELVLSKIDFNNI